MIKLQNLYFDNSTLEKSSIFFKMDKSKDFFLHDEVFIDKTEKKYSLVFNEPVHIFPNFHYFSNTHVKNIFLKIDSIIGNFTLKIYFVDALNSKTLIQEKKVFDKSSFVSDSIPLRGEVGYFYFEILTQSEDLMFNLKSISWTCDEKLPEHKILLGITTFKRENDLYRNLNGLTKTDIFDSLNFDILIVDNGCTINTDKYKEFSNIHFTKQENSGGTGGFMRSLVYAKDNNYSHNIFMDDDIDLNPEMLYRAVIFSLLCKEDMNVGLMMMKRSTPYVVWEQGAFINYDKVYVGYSYNFQLPLIDRENDALIEENVIKLHNNYKSQFSGWWGCIVPTSKTPILPYMFIKGDDVLSGIMLEKKGISSITLPTAMVWHEDFDKKPYTWQHYFDIRNGIFLRHYINKKVNKFSMAKQLFKIFLKKFLISDYRRINLIIKAFEDSLKNPDIFFKDINNNKIINSEVMKYMSLQDVSPLIGSLGSGNIKNFKFDLIKSIFMSVISSGRIDNLPDGRFLAIPLNSFNFKNVYKHKKIVFYDPYSLKGYIVNRSNKTSLYLLLKFIKLIILYLFKFNLYKNVKFEVSREYWINEFNEIE